MTTELTKALLLEEAALEPAVGEALHASLSRGVPFVHALIRTGAVSRDVLARYLARTEVPYVRDVIPLLELVDTLPPGLCARLLALPVRRDAITGTVDVAVADPTDAHAAREIAFHLGAPVRIVRSSLSAIDEAIWRLGVQGVPARAAAATIVDDELPYGIRTRSSAPRAVTLPPPGLGQAPARSLHLALEPDSSRGEAPAPGATSGAPLPHVRSRETPPWGTQINGYASEPPRSGLGSEIPIPLTRRTYATVSGGTQRPPPLLDPRESLLGEGIPFDPAELRQIVEVQNDRPPRLPSFPPAPAPYGPGSFIPGPPPSPSDIGPGRPRPGPDTRSTLAAIRDASSRDEILDLVLAGARTVALKVALFVVKRGGYMGWACTPEFGDRAALQSILVPLDAQSVFDEAVRDELYLGPIPQVGVHAALLYVMRGASRDVALVPIRVTGKTAVVIVADDLGDTMLATRLLEEIARAAGDAFARLVRARR